jgi:hypothetical protein
VFAYILSFNRSQGKESEDLVGRVYFEVTKSKKLGESCPLSAFYVKGSSFKGLRFVPTAFEYHRCVNSGFIAESLGSLLRDFFFVV